MEGEELTKPVQSIQSDTIMLSDTKEVTVSMYCKDEDGVETFLVGAMVFTPETHAGMKIKVVKEWEPLTSYSKESEAQLAYDQLMRRYKGEK